MDVPSSFDATSPFTYYGHSLNWTLLTLNLISNQMNIPTKLYVQSLNNHSIQK